MAKNKNYYTLFGINNTLSVLNSHKCSNLKIEIVKGSKLEENITLNKILKKSKVLFFKINKKDFQKKHRNYRNYNISISFNCCIIKKNIPKTFTKRNICFLVLDRIEDPQNFGQIIRTAECSGVDGIIFSKHKSVSITNIVLQVSQGAFLNIPLYEVINIKNEIKKLQNLGFWSIAIENKLNASKWYQLDYKNKIIIVFGSEGKGIRQKVLELCDYKGVIDMQGKINSLNVSASISAILFERLRQLKDFK